MVGLVAAEIRFQTRILILPSPKTGFTNWNNASEKIMDFEKL